jgi:hypothetical protein
MAHKTIVEDNIDILVIGSGFGGSDAAIWPRGRWRNLLNHFFPACRACNLPYRPARVKHSRADLSQTSTAPSALLTIDKNRDLTV